VFRRLVNELDLSPTLLMPDVVKFLVDRFDDWARNAEWWEFLDGCEVICECIDTFGGDRDRLRNRLNDGLLRYYSAYQMDEDGAIHEPGTEASEAATAEARSLLSQPQFSGPDRQFQRALSALSQRPDPQYEPAVNESINAVEGLLRVLLDDAKIQFGPAIDRVRTEHKLHSALASSLKNLHGYASDAGGRHGLVGAADADAAIAEFCVHQSAAAMVLLARLYGYEPKRATDSPA
jgi:hypothetical protein